MLYSFLYCVLGGCGYERFVKQGKQPEILWLLFACIGVATIVGLLLYHRFVAPRSVSTGESAA